MEKIGEMTIEASGDREIVVRREFDAPRDLVWDAWTKPELIRRWLGVRGGWTMPVCEMDLQPGGSYRWVWRGPDGAEMGMGGDFREVTPPERIVTTERFDDAWYEGDNVITTEFTDEGDRTTVTMTLRYDSSQIRDGVLAGPMKGGLAESLDQLADVLASGTAK